MQNSLCVCACAGKGEPCVSVSENLLSVLEVFSAEQVLLALASMVSNGQ